MKRSAIKIDLFTSVHHRKKIDQLGWSTTWHRGPISTFQHSHQRSILVVPHPVNAQGGRPPYPTETMVRILVLKRLHNLSDEQMEYQLLDRMSYQRFCGLEDAINIHGSHHYLEIWAAYWWKRSQGPIWWCIHSAIEKRIHCTWRADHRYLTGTCTEAEKQPQREQTPEAKSDPVRLEASQTSAER